MSSSRERRGSFAYHAQSIGLSAALTKPCCENIPSQASVSLSQTGGEGYSLVRDYNWKGLISFDEAASYVTGSKVEHDDKTVLRNTLSTVTIRNLNVANMVHADLVVARVTSKHVAGKKEGEITFAGSMIRNLVVAGEPINLEFDYKPFANKPTMDSFVAELQLPSGLVASTNAFMNEESGIISASLVKKPLGPEGYMLTIPQFGTIYVAQILMKSGYRRISMLRFDLGCPIEGHIEVAASEANGSEYFP
jgi:hypothetical protein